MTIIEAAQVTLAICAVIMLLVTIFRFPRGQ